jgi:hypothetical protein
MQSEKYQASPFFSFSKSSCLITDYFSFYLITGVLPLMTKDTYVSPTQATIAYRFSIQMAASCEPLARGVPAMLNSKDSRASQSCPMETYSCAIVKTTGCKSSNPLLFLLIFLVSSILIMIKTIINE